MPNYQFIERLHVYYTVEAESEEEAWEKLDQLNPPHLDKIWDSNISYDSVQCEINEIWESEDA